MARPIEEAVGVLGPSIAMVFSVVFLFAAVSFVFACTCCGWGKSKPRFQRFGVRGYDNARLSVTPMCSRPQSIITTSTTSPPPPNAFSNTARTLAPPSGDIIEFESLPQLSQLMAMADVKGRLTGDGSNSAGGGGGVKRVPLPALYNTCVASGVSAKDWFDDPLACFARRKLTYERQLGTGWFGKVIIGEARGIVPGSETTDVVIKQLRATSSLAEQMYFLHEMSPWRDSNHQNVLRLLGRCLEADPYLLILEDFGTCDLKQFLHERNLEQRQCLLSGPQPSLLRLACDVASALQHLHSLHYTHSDLAARNCLISDSLHVKIGDYGHSPNKYRDDYYETAGVAVPVRWYAPETLVCTDSTIETKQMTKVANVWSLGVLLWELTSFAALPYWPFSDDDVINHVINDCTVQLSVPKPPAQCEQFDPVSGQVTHTGSAFSGAAVINRLYTVMRLCWLPADQRPSAHRIHALLYTLLTSPSEDDFDLRWQTLQPNRRNSSSTSVSGATAADTSQSFSLESEVVCDALRRLDSMLATEPNSTCQLTSSASAILSAPSANDGDSLYSASASRQASFSLSSANAVLNRADLADFMMLTAPMDSLDYSSLMLSPSLASADVGVEQMRGDAVNGVGCLSTAEQRTLSTFSASVSQSKTSAGLAEATTTTEGSARITEASALPTEESARIKKVSATTEDLATKLDSSAIPTPTEKNRSSLSNKQSMTTTETNSNDSSKTAEGNSTESLDESKRLSVKDRVSHSDWLGSEREDREPINSANTCNSGIISKDSLHEIIRDVLVTSQSDDKSSSVIGSVLGLVSQSDSSKAVTSQRANQTAPRNSLTSHVEGKSQLSSTNPVLLESGDCYGSVVDGKERQKATPNGDLSISDAASHATGERTDLVSLNVNDTSSDLSISDAMPHTTGEKTDTMSVNVSDTCDGGHGGSVFTSHHLTSSGGGGDTPNAAATAVCGGGDGGNGIGDGDKSYSGSVLTLPHDNSAVECRGDTTANTAASAGCGGLDGGNGTGDGGGGGDCLDSGLCTLSDTVPCRRFSPLTEQSHGALTSPVRRNVFSAQSSPSVSSAEAFNPTSSDLIDRVCSGCCYRNTNKSCLSPCSVTSSACSSAVVASCSASAIGSDLCRVSSAAMPSSNTPENDNQLPSNDCSKPALQSMVLISTTNSVSDKKPEEKLSSSINPLMCSTPVEDKSNIGHFNGDKSAEMSISVDYHTALENLSPLFEADSSEHDSMPATYSDSNWLSVFTEPADHQRVVGSLTSVMSDTTRAAILDNISDCLSAEIYENTSLTSLPTSDIQYCAELSGSPIVDGLSASIPDMFVEERHVCCDSSSCNCSQQVAPLQTKRNEYIDRDTSNENINEFSQRANSNIRSNTNNYKTDTSADSDELNKNNNHDDNDNNNNVRDIFIENNSIKSDCNESNNNNNGQMNEAAIDSNRGEELVNPNIDSDIPHKQMGACSASDMFIVSANENTSDLEPVVWEFIPVDGNISTCELGGYSSHRAVLNEEDEANALVSNSVKLKNSTSPVLNEEDEANALVSNNVKLNNSTSPVLNEDLYCDDSDVYSIDVNIDLLESSDNCDTSSNHNNSDSDCEPFEVDNRPTYSCPMTDYNQSPADLDLLFDSSDGESLLCHILQEEQERQEARDNLEEGEEELIQYEYAQPETNSRLSGGDFSLIGNRSILSPVKEESDECYSHENTDSSESLGNTRGSYLSDLHETNLSFGSEEEEGDNGDDCDNNSSNDWPHGGLIHREGPPNNLTETSMNDNARNSMRNFSLDGVAKSVLSNSEVLDTSVYSVGFGQFSTYPFLCRSGPSHRYLSCCDVSDHTGQLSSFGAICHEYVTPFGHSTDEAVGCDIGSGSASDNTLVRSASLNDSSGWNSSSATAGDVRLRCGDDGDEESPRRDLRESGEDAVGRRCEDDDGEGDSSEGLRKRDGDGIGLRCGHNSEAGDLSEGLGESRK